MEFLKSRNNSYPYFTPRLLLCLFLQKTRRKSKAIFETWHRKTGGASVSPRADAPWLAAGCWLGGASLWSVTCVVPWLQVLVEERHLCWTQHKQGSWWVLFGTLQLSNLLSTWLLAEQHF